MNTAIEKALQEEFPDSTETECYRFWTAAEAAYGKSNWKSKAEKNRLIQKAARQNLEGFLEWRSLYGLDYDRPAKDAGDSIIWEWAAQKALFAQEARKRGNSDSVTPPKNATTTKSPVDSESNIDDVVNGEDGDGKKEKGESNTTSCDDNQNNTILFSWVHVIVLLSY